MWLSFDSPSRKTTQDRHVAYPHHLTVQKLSLYNRVRVRPMASSPFSLPFTILPYLFFFSFPDAPAPVPASSAHHVALQNAMKKGDRKEIRRWFINKIETYTWHRRFVFFVTALLVWINFVMGATPFIAAPSLSFSSDWCRNSKRKKWSPPPPKMV
jgi:hypothetical protein